jgi:uncharacterized membrane protein YqhA
MPDEPQGSRANAHPEPRPPRPLEVRTERALAASLRLAVIPVLVLLLAGLGAFVYGTALFVHSVGIILDHPFPAGHQVGLFLLDIDLFLIGATLLISAVGFYTLFVRELHSRGTAIMPAWLEIRDLNDLKARVIAMVVLVLAVTFGEVIVDSPSGRDALYLGIGIGAVVIALTAFIRLSTAHPGERR